MIYKYIEKDILRKIKIIKLLLPGGVLSSTCFSKKMNVSSLTIKNDIKSINTHYNDSNFKIIQSSKEGYSIKDKTVVSSVVQKIYNDSIFLKGCLFFIEHNFDDVHVFSQREFISISRAYEVRNNVINYMEDVEIDVYNHNKIGNECRIRFLIAFIQIKFHISYIRYETEYFEKFFKEVEDVEGCLFSTYSKNYASLLFTLHLKRNAIYPVTFYAQAIELFKNTPVYFRMLTFVYKYWGRDILESITEEDTYYLALVFNIMNAVYYDDVYGQRIHESYVDIFKNNKFFRYQELLFLLEDQFKISFRENKLFDSAFSDFMRKAIFNLQIFIPEEHAEIGRIGIDSENMAISIKKILIRWNNITGINLKFSNAHIRLLASRIYFLVHKKKRKNNVYLLTSYFTDFLLAKEILQSEFSGVINIFQFDPRKNTSSYEKNDLILYDAAYDILSSINCSKLRIDYVFDMKELQLIRKSLCMYDLDGFLKV